MTLPNYFRPKENSSTTFDIGVDPNRTKVVTGTSTKDQNLFLIGGTGIATWKLDRKDFPTVLNLPFSKGEQTAVAVLDKPITDQEGSRTSKLHAIALGIQDDERLSLSKIKFNDGTVKQLETPIKVEVVKGKIKSGDAERLSAFVIEQAAAWEKAKGMAVSTRSAPAVSEFPPQVANDKKKAVLTP